MRIISQDGMIDMPYEHMVINISYKNKKQIVASGVNCEADSSIFPIAEYSTEDKAVKVMELLRNIYCESKKEVAYREGTFYLVTHFRFPADDEIDARNKRE